MAANFGREKNDEAKQRKVAVEYVKLCGYRNGGDRKSEPNSSELKKSQSDLATQMGISVDTFQN